MGRLLAVADELSATLTGLRFAAPVSVVYDPTTYAREPLAAYLRLVGEQPGRALLLGMNPGPFGMTQTGVPFGTVSLVRDWLGVRGAVYRPPIEHPKRPVLGWSIPREEVSGQRLWGLFRHHYRTPEATFERLVVLNYCPLVFLEAGGRNLTPDKLKAEEQRALFDACDRALRQALQVLQPALLIGVGAFAEDRLRRVAPAARIGRIPHPSPASPLANRGYARQAGQALRDLGVDLPGELADT